jgi:hypothetical protein
VKDRYGEKKVSQVFFGPIPQRFYRSKFCKGEHPLPHFLFIGPTIEFPLPYPNGEYLQSCKKLFHLLLSKIAGKDGRVVECGGLENRTQKAQNPLFLGYQLT